MPALACVLGACLLPEELTLVPIEAIMPLDGGPLKHYKVSRSVTPSLDLCTNGHNAPHQNIIPRHVEAASGRVSSRLVQRRINT